MNTVISFSCPAHLALRLNEEGIAPRAKSQWISEAIKLKLDGVSITAHPSRHILAYACSIIRRDDESLALLVQKHLDEFHNIKS
jgi:hypothetical protein